MQSEIEAEGLPVDVQILGINEVGHESGNPTMCEGRTLPWLQDVAEQKVWTTWAPVFRDVVLVDPQNQKIEAYNLTEHNLADANNYAALKQKLEAAALAAAP